MNFQDFNNYNREVLIKAVLSNKINSKLHQKIIILLLVELLNMEIIAYKPILLIHQPKEMQIF